MPRDTNTLPNWVKVNPEKYSKRLRYEVALLSEQFPFLGFFMEGDSLRIEGPVMSASLNVYQIRVAYEAEYPARPPTAFIIDKDVSEFCSKEGNVGHNFHNYGMKNHGLGLCLMAQDEWTPQHSGISVVEYAIAWINAYECKRVRGYWPLREQ